MSVIHNSGIVITSGSVDGAMAVGPGASAVTSPISPARVCIGPTGKLASHG